MKKEDCKIGMYVTNEKGLSGKVVWMNDMYAWIEDKDKKLTTINYKDMQIIEEYQ